MDNRGEMLQLCRLCLVKDDVNIPIFEEQGDIRQIFLKISSCLPVKVSREDKLPKKICDGCSYKLDMLYEFWNTTANAEKQLLSWLGEAGMNSKMTDGTMSAVAQQIKPVETFVKQEAIDPSDIHTEENDDDKSYMFQQKFTIEEAGPSATVTSNTSNEEEPPPKRARRTAAVKAQIAMDPESDEDEDSGEPMTKVEDESEDSDGDDHEPAFVDVPSTSADDQPGPSGVGKDGVEAPFPMDFFTPIVTINEAPPEPSSKSPKIKKIKIKIEGSEEGEISAEIVKQKRGRPKKVVVNSETEDKKEKSKPKESSDEDDPSWVSGAEKKKKRKGKKPKENKKNKAEKKKSPSTEKMVEVKIEPPDESEVNSETVVIKKEIKEEPLDPDLPVILPLSEEEFKSMLPPEVEDTRMFKCPLCSKDKQDKTERTPKDLKQHYKNEHPGKRLRQSRFSLEVHPCDICGKEFKTSGAVKEHVETHSSYFYCEICNSSHKKILDHIIHLRVHSEAGMFQCLMCNYKTSDINEITEHVNNHEDLLKYWCQTCKKGFQILPWFQEHDNYHTGLKPFDCEFCGKCFLYSRYLHAHKINMHKEDMNCPSLHECVICKKQYQHKNSLKLHMNSHTGNFSICDICGKMLSSKEKLKFHIRTHTGYKPYSCTYCEKSFTKKPILVEHVRIHTGERPYVCEYCTKAFSQRSSLVIHIRGHTGERPYVCQFCTKGFVAKAMLNIHLKSCKGLAISSGS